VSRAINECGGTAAKAARRGQNGFFKCQIAKLFASRRVCLRALVETDSKFTAAMALATTRAEKELQHDSVATEITTLLQKLQPIVARCAGPKAAGAALAAACAAAKEDCVVVVTATPRRTARELEALVRGTRDVLVATATAPEVIDSTFWDRLFASSDDAAVDTARALAGVAKRTPSGRTCVVCEPRWLRRELLSGQPTYLDVRLASKAAYCFDVDVLLDPIAADCCTVLKASQTPLALVLFREGEGPHAPACAAWLDASLETVGASSQRRLWCWPPGKEAPLRLRIGAEDDAWPRALALARRGIEGGATTVQATALAVAYLLETHTCVKVVTSDLSVADAIAGDVDDAALRKFVRRCAPSSKTAKASAAAWLQHAQRGVAVVADAWSRDASGLAAQQGLVKVVVCGLQDRISAPACVVAGFVEVERGAYAALAEGDACDLIQVLDGTGDERWRAVCVDGAPLAVLTKVFPRPRVAAALLLRAASLDTDAQLALVTGGLAAHLKTCGGVPASGSDDEEDERACCDELAMLLLRRPAHASPWLKRGRVGRHEGSKWCCVVGLVPAKRGATNAATRLVEVVLEAAPWCLTRVVSSSVRLTGVVVTLADDLTRPGNIDACRRATLEALDALQTKTKKKRKRRLALFLDELDVIEVKDAGDAAAYRSLAARAAALTRGSGDERSEAERSALFRRVYAREVRRAARAAQKSAKAAKLALKALRKLGLADKKGKATPSASIALACVARFGGDDRAALVASLACFPADGATSPLGALAPRLLIDALAAVACPLRDDEAAFVEGIVAYDPSTNADDGRAFAAARAALEAAARAVGRACGDDALVAEELAIAAVRPRAGLPPPAALLGALAAAADVASDAAFAGRLRAAAGLGGGEGGVY